MIIEADVPLSLKENLTRLAPFIGNTPLFPITRLHRNKAVQIFAKLEWQQLGGSVKSRPAFNIIKAAVEKGLLEGERHLLDATSGNTGIAYAYIGSKLGIPVTLCLPENASGERKMILSALGANIVYTSRFDSTDGAQEKAQELAAALPDRYYYANQYSNDENWRAHYNSTAVEIYRQTGELITHFVAGLGTTGTFIGTGRRLKELNPGIQLVALHPDSPLHGLEGWKHLETARVPKIYDYQLADLHLEIESEEAYGLIKETARCEGLLLSPSAAANLAGAIQVANSLEEGVVVTVFPDNSDKYQEVLARIFND